MAWWELRLVSARGEIAALESALEDLGVLSLTLVDNADDPILEPALGETPLWDTTGLNALFDENCPREDIDFQLKQQFPSLKLDWHKIEDRDWEREWMRDYHAIQVSDALWICPSWQDAPDPNAVNLMLDPGLAFGTGTHPTTFLCLQWLARRDRAPELVLDYGCGSGILAIAALLLGAKHAVGIDIDPQALIASADNLERNHLRHSRLSLATPDNSPALQADIVLANILAAPLIDLAPTLLGYLKPEGSICLSGILFEQHQTVLDAYAPHLRDIEVERKSEWVRISGTKHPDPH